MAVIHNEFELDWYGSVNIEPKVTSSLKDNTDDEMNLSFVGTNESNNASIYIPKVSKYTGRFLSKKWQVPIMETAVVWSKQSKCSIKKVAAVLSLDENIYLVRYNGTIAGTNNRCELNVLKCPECGYAHEVPNGITGEYSYTCKCGVKSDMKNVEESVVVITNPNVLHAEQNIITEAAAQGISTYDKTLTVTVAPCLRCAKLIIAAKISEVVYLEDFKNDIGLKLLLDNGVALTKLLSMPE